MNSKRTSLMVLTAVVISIFLLGTVFAAEQELVDPNIPDSWYETPKLASEMEIKQFNQSPILDKKVQEGEISSVEERLPQDPPVIEPYQDIGKYGGTVTVWDRQLAYYELSYFNGNVNGGRFTPDGSKVIPFLLKDWEYNQNYDKLTIYLRKGVKWSNGDPITAEDYMYWWEHVANNEYLNPTPPEKWDPSLLDVTREDNWTVTFHYGNSAPNNYIGLHGNMGANWELAPHNYMKQFHPDYVDKEKVQKMAEDAGLEEWYDYYQRIQEDSPTHPEYEHQRPVYSPYVAEERTETTLIMKRNPYFPFIDTGGNQLPYIDKIRVNLANSEEMAATKASTGEATFAARHTLTSDIPLYKRNEENEDYRTLLYRRANGSEINIYLNQSTKDLKLRSIFQDIRFRRAVSLAINREKINNKVYYGEAIPMQSTIIPIHKYFKEEYAEAYAEYDPEHAEKLLDEMGMVDRNGDGYRDMPEGTFETMSGEKVVLEGEEFNPQFLYCLLGAIKVVPQVLELVREDLRAIGLNIDLKMVSRELHDIRWGANEASISMWQSSQLTGPTFYTFAGLRYFAPVFSSPYVPWPGWTNWYTSDGEEGVEPPEKVKQLIEWAETVAYTTDPEKREQAVINLLESQAKNLWMIGTVAFGPSPIIAKNNLKNIPEKGLWDAGIGYMRPYNTEQFYLDE